MLAAAAAVSARASYVDQGVAAQRFDTLTARRLADTALRGRSLEYAEELTATIGARLTGTSSYERAAQWAERQFGAAGVPATTLEPFTIPRGWERATRAAARIVAPVQRALTLESLGWAPSTPDAGIEGEVIGSAGLTLAPHRARRRVVLMTGSVPRDFDRTMKDAGALALLFPDTDRENRLAARVRAFGGDLAALPSAGIARDDAELLRRLLDRGPVRIAFAFRNAITSGPVAVSNVIAEIKGRDRPDEFIVVGAHLDSWDFATGAQDNATGVAMVLEAARAIAALGRPPRRSIRFALWGGEEQGLLGSAAYATAHEHELDWCVAVLNTDGGTGRIIGWTTPGRDDVMARVGELSRALLADLQTTAVDRSMRYAFDSDAGPFIRLGVPGLDLNVDDSAYEGIHHKTTDTMERVNPRNLAVGAATVAVTVYALADAPDRLVPRGPRLGEQ